MLPRFGKLFAVAVVLLFFLSGIALAQPKSIQGIVSDARSGQPLPGANIVISKLGQVDFQRGDATDENGRFEIKNLPFGTYSIRISYIGYEKKNIEKFEFQQESKSTLNFSLEPSSIQMNPVSITASRRPEKILESPAAINVIESDQIEARATTTVVDHLKGQPAVDVLTSGIVFSNIAVRGFNAPFSGSLLMLIDNRIARVPSLRLNIYSLVPASNEDIDRIEVVSGPGSALYGPNSANGVLHILTKSPLSFPGTHISFAGGERSLRMGSFRHAQKLNDKIGLKISGQYYKGEDWKQFDPAEPDSITLGRQTVQGRESIGGPILNERNFTVDKKTLDARLDVKLSDETTLILNSAVDEISENVITDIGAASANDWRYSYFQGRLTHKNLFLQGFLNKNSAGQTYFYRTGDLIADDSRLMVWQAQHFFDLGRNQRFTYGLDALLTRPDTKNTINGSNEETDNINEFGAYFQSETDLSTRFKFVAAARADRHSKLDDLIFSPRAALVYKTPAGHNFRATYNKAFSTPTTNHLFLDILTTQDVYTLGAILEPSLGFNGGTNMRAQGVPESGFQFRMNNGAPQFRSPFAPLDPRNLSTNDFIDLNDPTFTNVMWQVAKTSILDGFAESLRISLREQGFSDIVIDNLIFELGENIIPQEVTGVGNTLKRLNLETQAFELDDNVRDVARLQPTTTQTWELGYKGLLNNRLLMTFDLYHSKINNFIGPLFVETPNVFLDAATLRASLTPQISENINASNNFLLRGFINQLDDPANGGNGNGDAVDDLVGVFADNAAEIPLGTVSPEGASDPTAVVLTYRNFGEIDLTGADLSLMYYLNDNWVVGGNYSYVSENLFERSETLLHDIPLNAPKHKAGFSLSRHFRGLKLNTELRGRYVQGYPFRAGELIGDIDSYAVVDLNASHDLSSSTKVTLSVSNLTNNRHREVIGAPEIGRLGLLRVMQTF